MGKYNSSIYRVCPLMKVIETDYSAFLNFLSLVNIPPLDRATVFRYDGENPNNTEMQLKPTKKHLLSLIDYLATKEHKRISATSENRKDLFFGTKKKREELQTKAKNELEDNYDKLCAAGGCWYVFEGFTNPDIFIEGDDYVIICEGKWTEPHITTTTTYLSSDGEYRNQMIRHIQGALNYTNKKVYAFYIVDANCGYTDDLTTESLQRQLECETIQPSKEEKQKILGSFYGFTTWQEIKNKIPQCIFKEKSEIIVD